MHDLVIRNGLIFDGTGAPAFEGDIAVDGDKITAVGQVSSGGAEEIDARGQIVAPGFVDIHTHYDGQVTWDPYLTPSTWHGVTTAVMGNCGVGFAPVAPDRHDWLIGLMEGVEDIPGSALAEGIDWKWESFPEFMDAIERGPHAIDVGLQMPHGALRAYVMGDRAAKLEAATDEEIARMGDLVGEALRAGALGFSTSRTEKHRDRYGEHTPTFEAADQELHGIARAIRKVDLGVIQLIADFFDFDTEFAMLRKMCEIAGRPMALTIEQDDRYPNVWLTLLANIKSSAADGVPIYGQVSPRPTGIWLGLTATLNPFIFHKTYREIGRLPLEEQVAALRNPDFRARLLAEEVDIDKSAIVGFIVSSFHKMYDLGDPADYEPSPERSIAARAQRNGKNPLEIALDMMLEDDGKALIYMTLMNYLREDLEDIRTMMTHERAIFGLSDAGAHCGAVCDASYPTTLLTHWGRDRARGEKLPLEWLIAGQTSKTADYIGLHDRGRIAAGYKADINVIDHDNLTLHPPRVIYDLPASGKRLVQKADGYTATIVSGSVAFREGQPTGAPLAGRLVRGKQKVVA